MKREWNLPPVGNRSLRLKAILKHLGRVAVIATISLSINTLAVAANRDAAVRRPVAKTRHWLETGEASWYGRKFQGHKTATGEPFDMNGLTCAHRSLPLGSWVRVTNLHTRKSVFVRVNDRGPVINSRIVDLSYAAARAVGLTGIGRVKLETVSPNDPEMTKALVAQWSEPAPPFVPAL